MLIVCVLRDKPDAADVLFLRVLYRICNPILLSIRIFNPPVLFYYNRRTKGVKSY